MECAFKEKLDAYVAGGGKILASGDSAITDGKMVYDLGCTYEGKSKYCPGYVNPKVPLKNLDPATYVVYGEGNVVKLTENGTELANREQPYFNRSIVHFCSHQHAPNSGVIEGSAITAGSQGGYIGWKVFREYATKGSLILREVVTATLDHLLGKEKTLETNLPAQGITTVMDQIEQHRLVNHLLYASPVKRGDGIEIIEDILPVYGVKVTLRPGREIKRVYLAPQMQDIPFTQENGEVKYTVERLECHQMVVLDY